MPYLSTEEQHLSHLQARLIPRPIFTHLKLFSSVISTQQQKLMSSSLDATSVKIKKDLPEKQIEKLKLLNWICVLLSHPNDSNADLLATAANKLGLNNELIINGLLIVKRLDMITDMFHDSKFDMMIDNLNTVIRHNNASIFDIIGFEGYNEIVIFVLSSPACFEFLERSEKQYYEIVHTFVMERINWLLQEAEQSMLDIFDVNTKEAPLYFYFLRHLIRCNDDTLLSAIQFLLEIPSVKELAHKEITDDVPNELIRLALKYNNIKATLILISIKEVYKLASINHFYAEENSKINLHRLVVENNLELDCTDTYDLDFEMMNGFFSSLSMNSNNTDCNERVLYRPQSERIQALIDFLFSNNLFCPDLSTLNKKLDSIGIVKQISEKTKLGKRQGNYFNFYSNSNLDDALPIKKQKDEDEDECLDFSRFSKID